MRVNKLRRASDNEQGLLTLSKRAIAKENLMSLISRGCPKNTDYGGKSIPKKTSTGIVSLFSSPCLQPESDLGCTTLALHKHVTESRAGFITPNVLPPDGLPLQPSAEK